MGTNYSVDVLKIKKVRNELGQFPRFTQPPKTKRSLSNSVGKMSKKPGKGSWGELVQRCLKGVNWLQKLLNGLQIFMIFKVLYEKLF